MEFYEFISKISEGAYGAVWKAKSTEDGTIVAIKRMKDVPSNQEELAISLREIKLLQRCLDHPNIVQLLEAYQSTGGRLYLVFEYVPHTLLQLLQLNRRGLSIENTRSIMWQLLNAVDFLHQNKMMHRDIKPANVLISSVGEVKLCDFGFARPLQKLSVSDFTTYVITRWYRPVEVLVGDTYSTGVDIWSLGCVFVEMVTGRPLFPGKSHHQQLYMILQSLGQVTESQDQLMRSDPQFVCFRPPSTEQLEPLERKLSSFTPAMMEVVHACLHFDPDQRLSAADVMKLPFFADEHRSSETGSASSTSETGSSSPSGCSEYANRTSTSPSTSTSRPASADAGPVAKRRPPNAICTPTHEVVPVLDGSSSMLCDLPMPRPLHAVGHDASVLNEAGMAAAAATAAAAAAMQRTAAVAVLSVNSGTAAAPAPANPTHARRNRHSFNSTEEAAGGTTQGLNASSLGTQRQEQTGLPPLRHSNSGSSLQVRPQHAAGAGMAGLLKERSLPSMAQPSQPQQLPHSCLTATSQLPFSYRQTTTEATPSDNVRGNAHSLPLSFHHTIADDHGAFGAVGGHSDRTSDHTMLRHGHTSGSSTSAPSVHLPPDQPLLLSTRSQRSTDIASGVRTAAAATHGGLLAPTSLASLDAKTQERESSLHCSLRERDLFMLEDAEDDTTHGTIMPGVALDDTLFPPPSGAASLTRTGRQTWNGVLLNGPYAAAEPITFQRPSLPGNSLSQQPVISPKAAARPWHAVAAASPAAAAAVAAAVAAAASTPNELPSLQRLGGWHQPSKRGGAVAALSGLVPGSMLPVPALLQHLDGTVRTVMANTTTTKGHSNDGAADAGATAADGTRRHDAFGAHRASAAAAMLPSSSFRAGRLVATAATTTATKALPANSRTAPSLMAMPLGSGIPPTVVTVTVTDSVRRITDDGEGVSMARQLPPRDSSGRPSNDGGASCMAQRDRRPSNDGISCSSFVAPVVARAGNEGGATSPPADAGGSGLQGSNNGVTWVVADLSRHTFGSNDGIAWAGVGDAAVVKQPRSSNDGVVRGAADLSKRPSGSNDGMALAGVCDAATAKQPHSSNDGIARSVVDLPKRPFGSNDGVARAGVGDAATTKQPRSSNGGMAHSGVDLPKRLFGSNDGIARAGAGDATAPKLPRGSNDGMARTSINGAGSGVSDGSMGRRLSNDGAGRPSADISIRSMSTKQHPSADGARSPPMKARFSVCPGPFPSSTVGPPVASLPTRSSDQLLATGPGSNSTLVVAAKTRSFKMSSRQSRNQLYAPHVGAGGVIVSGAIADATVRVVGVSGPALGDSVVALDEGKLVPRVPKGSASTVAGSATAGDMQGGLRPLRKGRSENGASSGGKAASFLVMPTLQGEGIRDSGFGSPLPH